MRFGIWKWLCSWKCSFCPWCCPHFPDGFLPSPTLLVICLGRSLEPSHGVLPCTSWRSGWSIFGGMTLEEGWSHPESRAGALNIRALLKGYCWAWHHDKHIQSKRDDLILRPICTVPHNLLTDTVWDTCTGFQLIFMSSSGNLSFPPLHLSCACSNAFLSHPRVSNYLTQAACGIQLNWNVPWKSCA